MAEGGNERQVLDFLNKSNRPTNCQVLADNLQKYAIKKTQVQKALDALEAKDLISSKEFGKQKIYFARQDQFECLSRDELAEAERVNQELRVQVREATERARAAEAEAQEMASSLTQEEIVARVEELKPEVAAMEAKLAALREGGVKLCSKEDRAKAIAAAEKVLVAWKKRKAMCRDIVDTLAEGMEKRPKVLMQDCGVETDEDVGVSMQEVEATLRPRGAEPPVPTGRNSLGGG